MNQLTVSKPLILLFFLVISIIIVSCHERKELPNDLISTTEGYYQGQFERSSIISFKGVPYAKPPLNELRFENPVLPDSFSGTKRANQPGSICPQFDVAKLLPTMIGDEDCLTLNIYRPSAEGKYPIMVWIHAGSFMWGDSTGRSEDNISLHGQPYRLVDEGVVFISINYRLGVLGFLASYDSNTDTTQGNYGLSDQQLALRWIRNNASTFDGDPNNITIIGSSAGGKSVLTHFAMPSSEGLFNRGIIQSGIYDFDESIEVVDALALGGVFSEAIGCPKLSIQKECLKSKSKEEILTTQLQLGYKAYPVTGINTFKTNPLEINESDYFNKADLMVGTNLDEMNIFIPDNELKYGKSKNTNEGYTSSLKNQLALDNSTVEFVKAVYPLTAYENITHTAVAKVQTDFGFSCPSLKAARVFRKNRNLYFYVFSDTNAPYSYLLSPELELPDNFTMGAAHLLEVAYILGDNLNQIGFSEAQVSLAEKMTDYWSSFAKSGKPKTSNDNVNWDTFNQGNFLSLDTTINIKTESEYSFIHNCDNFWLLN